MKNLKKNIIWNAIGSTFYSFISLFLMLIVTRINGLDVAGIFTYAFSTACIFYTIGVYYGRVYQVSEKNKKILDSDFIYSKIILCFIMIFISIIFISIKKYDFVKSAIILLLCLYKAISAFAESYYAIIQKENNLHYVGKSMLYKTISEVLAFFIIDYFTHNVIITILSIIIIDVFFIELYDKRKIIKLSWSKFSKHHLLYLLKSGFTICAFSFLSIYVINASKYAIDVSLSDDLQAIYGIIIMPATIMSLFSQFIIQPYLVKINIFIKEKNYTDFLKMVCLLILYMIIIGIVCVIGAYFLGIPILNFIYNIDLYQYQLDFTLIIIGSIFYGLSVLISFILISMNKNLSQLIVMIILTVVSYFTSNWFVSNYQLLGASLNYLITMILDFILYFIFLVFYMIKFKKVCQES